jgi:hypothetical protein
MSKTAKTGNRVAPESRKGTEHAEPAARSGHKHAGSVHNTAPREASTGPLRLADRPAFFNAIDNFVRANTNFESSVPLNAAIDELENATRLQDIFQQPLQRQLFSFEAALRWALFMAVAPDHAVKEGDPEFTDSFSVQDAMVLITQVYDIAVQDHVWEHFEDDEEDESDEGDEDEKI